MHQIGPDQEQRDLVLVYNSDEPFCMIKRPLFLKSLHVIIAKLNHNPSPRHCCLHVCVCGCVPPGDSMAMALVQRRTPDAHNFLFPRRHPISGLEIMELRDDPRNSLNRPDIWTIMDMTILSSHDGLNLSKCESNRCPFPIGPLTTGNR